MNPENKNSQPAENHSSQPNVNAAEMQTTNMGKNMLVVAWIIGLGLLTLLFGAWEGHQINPNSDPHTYLSEKAAVVVLKANRYGHYLTQGSINQSTVTFLLDTGATAVAIPGELNQWLNLPKGAKHYTHTANGTAEAYFTTIDTLQFGEIQLHNVKASIIPNMRGEDVLLGMTVLKQLEFSQKDNELSLRQTR